MQLIQAIVKSQPRIVETKFGVRSVMDVTLPNGQEQAIWGPENFMPIVTRKPGESVQLGKDSKGKFHCIEQEITQALKQDKPQGMTPDTKKAIAAYVSQQRDLLAFCWSEAERIDGPCTEESVQKLATTLFLAAQRKFNLA